MFIINPDDYGIKNDHDITEALSEMLNDISLLDGDKTLKFKKGVYYLNSDKCNEYKLVITNTASKKDFSQDESPHINAVPFYIGNTENLTLDGNGSIFVINGRTTNIALENSKNIILKNFEIRTENPDLHELEVININKEYVDFIVDEGSLIKDICGIPHFYGHGYTRSLTKDISAGYIGLIHKNTPDKIERTLHPINGYKKIEKISEKVYRIYYNDTSRFSVGDCFYIYDVRRQFAGIFINRSNNISLDNIKETFNYSLALVAQDSADISINNSSFAPYKNSPLKVASCADFIQCCMCRGLFSVTNSNFEGAGDDCMNVHGIHFKIVSVNKDKIIVRFMHSETYGFNPLHKDDYIEFISPFTLLSEGSARILSSELISDTDIELQISDPGKAKKGLCIEDISACPDVYFGKNSVKRIITRALLLTTRGKVVIENNNFISCTMSGILISDDARSWYESGMCRDITIKNNNFDYCGETPILIKPENIIHKGPVHKNINITGNKFKHNGESIKIKSSGNINIQNNTFTDENYLKTINCTEINAQ